VIEILNTDGADVWSMVVSAFQLVCAETNVRLRNVPSFGDDSITNLSGHGVGTLADGNVLSSLQPSRRIGRGNGRPNYDHACCRFGTQRKSI
jgi:hypothetical protein